LQPQTDGSIVLALMGGHTGATWRIQLKLYFLLPTPVGNPNGKSIASAIFAQLTAESPYTLQRAFVCRKIVPSYGGIWTPHLCHDFLGKSEPENPNSIAIGSTVLAQMTT